MPKNKQTEVDVDINNDLLEEEGRDYQIISALISDDYCDFSYEVIRGIGKTNKHKVKGKQIIKDDLKKAMARLNVHMAIIDDAFKIGEVEFTSLAEVIGHDLTFLYEVYGFEISGSEENESISLLASKSLSLGGRMDLKTQKIPLDNLSSYRWREDLKEATDLARNEVALYHEGKYIEQEEEEEVVKPNKRQTKLQFAQPANAEEGGDELPLTDSGEVEDLDEDFQNARV